MRVRAPVIDEKIGSIAMRIVDGHWSMRHVGLTDAILDGEVLFDEPPSEAALAEAFPGYLDVKRREAKAALAELRWRVMTGGLVVQGIAIKTDDLARQTIHHLAALGEPQPHFKAADGVFHVLSAADLQEIARALSAFVKACFAHEARLVAEIDSAADPAALNLTAGWPR